MKFRALKEQFGVRRIAFPFSFEFDILEAVTIEATVTKNTKLNYETRYGDSAKKEGSTLFTRNLTAHILNFFSFFLLQIQDHGSNL